MDDVQLRHIRYWILDATNVGTWALGVNWRATIAMIISVPLTLPGLVNTINTNIHVGVGTHLFDITFPLEVSVVPSPLSRDQRILPDTLQFTLASAMYYMLSSLFPTNDIVLGHVILEHDMLPNDKCHSGIDG